MNVRLYQPQDNALLAQLFSETVRAVDSSDYSAEQVAVWASEPPDMERWRCQSAGRLVLVAECGQEIVGFASFEPNGHLDHLYAHHKFQRRGVASALLRQIEEEAASRGIHRLFTEASISAHAFFQRAGFRVIVAQTVELEGVSFLNYRMEKLLA